MCPSPSRGSAIALRLDQHHERHCALLCWTATAARFASHVGCRKKNFVIAASEIQPRAEIRTRTEAQACGAEGVSEGEEREVARQVLEPKPSAALGGVVTKTGRQRRQFRPPPTKRKRQKPGPTQKRKQDTPSTTVSVARISLRSPAWCSSSWRLLKSSVGTATSSGPSLPQAHSHAATVCRRQASYHRRQDARTSWPC